MTTLPLAPPPEDFDRKPESTQQVLATIGRNVTALLGRPRDLFQVAVRPLWDNHYRVNVYLGTESVAATIANSYFLTVDARGNILDSSPKVTREYGP